MANEVATTGDPVGQQMIAEYPLGQLPNTMYQPGALAGIGRQLGQAIPPHVMSAGDYETRIQRVGNGWIVKVGCQTFVSTDWNEISMGLKEFYDDPQKAYDKWVVKKENANV